MHKGCRNVRHYNRGHRAERVLFLQFLHERILVKLRETMATHSELTHKLSDLEQRIEDHDEQIQVIFEAIRQLMLPPDQKGKKKIGFTVKEKQKAYHKKS